MARSSGARKKARSTAQATAIQDKKRERIAQLYLRGRTQREIAADPGVKLNNGNVCRQLKAIRDEWKSRAAEDYAVRLNRDLDKLDHLEAEAWSEYQRSRQDAVRETVEAGGDEKATGEATTKAKRARKVTVTEGRCGDPRFLSLIESLIDKRLKLIGAYAPTKIAPTTPDGKESFRPYANMPLDELLKLAKEAEDESPQA